MSELEMVMVAVVLAVGSESGGWRCRWEVVVRGGVKLSVTFSLGLRP